MSVHPHSKVDDTYPPWVDLTTIPKARCPRWEQFFRVDVMGDDCEGKKDIAGVFGVDVCKQRGVVNRSITVYLRNRKQW